MHTSIHPYIHPSITLHLDLHLHLHLHLHYMTLHYITYIRIHSYSFILRCIYIYIEIQTYWSLLQYMKCISYLLAGFSDLWNTCFTCLFIHPPKMGYFLFTWPSFLAIRSLTGTPKDRSKTAWLEVSSKTRVEGSPESRWESCLETCAQIGALLALMAMGPAFSSMVFTKTGVVI